MEGRGAHGRATPTASQGRHPAECRRVHDSGITYPPPHHAVLFFAEVAHHAVLPRALILLGHDVEHKGLHVEVQRLVVQEQLGQQAQVLAVCLGVRPVQLPKRRRVGRTQGGTARHGFEPRRAGRGGPGVKRHTSQVSWNRFVRMASQHGARGFGPSAGVWYALDTFERVAQGVTAAAQGYQSTRTQRGTLDLA